MASTFFYPQITQIGADFVWLYGEYCVDRVYGYGQIYSGPTAGGTVGG